MSAFDPHLTQPYEPAQLQRPQDLGTQVWCGNELVGYLKHLPFSGSILVVNTVERPSPDLGDFANSLMSDYEVVLRDQIHLKLTKRYYQVDQLMLEMARDKREALDQIRLQHHIPADATMEQNHGSQSLRFTWSVFGAGLDKCERLFDLDEFTPAHR